MVLSSALLIRKTSHREHDHVLELLTPDFGKITVAARGTRRISSKLNPHLLYLNTLAVGFVEGPKNKVLVNVDTIDYFKSTDYRAYRAGFEIITLIDERVWADLPEPFTFELVRHAIRAIASHVDEPRLTVLLFKVQFLKALGYLPDFTRCVACMKCLATRRVFSFTHGGLLCDTCVFANDMIEIKDNGFWGMFEAFARSGFEGGYAHAVDQEKMACAFMDKLINYFAHTRLSKYEAY